MSAYLTEKELEEFDRLLSIVGKDTYRLWYATEVRGASASMVSGGNESSALLQLFVDVDKRIPPAR